MIALSAISVPQFLQIMSGAILPQRRGPVARTGSAGKIKWGLLIGLYLVRSSRWRRGFVAACLPYLLLSVFVDFLHVHPAWGRAGLHVQVAAAPSTLTVPRHSLPSCPIIPAQSANGSGWAPGCRRR